MFKRTVDDIELEKLLRNQKSSLSEIFQKNYEVQQQTLNLFQEAIQHCDFNSFPESREIWNFGSFINIISFDLKTIGENLFFCENEWGKRYFARQAALLIYEAIEDIFELLGKSFREIIKKLPEADILQLMLKDCIKHLNSYKSDHFDRLKAVRNNCSAHRDQDSIRQLEVITSLSWSEAISFTSQFDQILTRLGKLSQRLLDGSLPG